MYREVLYNISIFEKKKSRNLDRIKTLEKENSRLSDELKKLYNFKNQFEKLNTEAFNLIITKKEYSAKENHKIAFSHFSVSSFLYDQDCKGELLNEKELL